MLFCLARARICEWSSLSTAIDVGFSEAALTMLSPLVLGMVYRKPTRFLGEVKIDAMNHHFVAALQHTGTLRAWPKKVRPESFFE
jgi:hypothetical protein